MVDLVFAPLMGASLAALAAVAVPPDIEDALERGDRAAVEAAVRREPRASAAWFDGAWLRVVRARAGGRDAQQSAERLERVAGAFERVHGDRARKARLALAASWSAERLRDAARAADLGRRARAALERGDRDAARKGWGEAAAIAERIGDRVALGRIRLALAGLDRKAGRSREASGHAEKAVEAFRTAGDRLGLAGALWTLAGITRGEDPRRAADLWKASAEIHEALGDRVRAGLGRFNGAVSLRDAHHLEEAERAFRRAAELLAGSRYEVLALKNLGIVRARRDDLDGAAETLGRALEGARAAGEPVERARIADELADVHRARGMLQEAEATYVRAIESLPDAAGPRERIAAAERTRLNLLADLGSLRVERGDLRGALEAFHGAARIARRLRDPGEIARALANLGNLALRQGNARRAISEYRIGLRAQRESGRRDPLREALLLEDIGLALAGIGEEESAQASYARAQAALEGLDGPEAERARARIELKVAALAREADPARAREHAERARERLERIGDRRLLATAYNNLGNLLADAGDHARAVALFRRSLALRGAASDPLGRAIGLSNLGESLLALGVRDEARRAIDEALGLLEASRRAVTAREDRDYFLQGKGSFYENAVRAALASGASASAIREAFGYAERARARALVELLGEAASEVETRIPASLRRERAALRAERSRLRAALRGALERRGRGKGTPEIERLERRIEEIDGALRRLAEAIDARAPTGAALTPARTATADEAMALLRPREVMLAYILGDRGSWVFVLQRHGLAVHELPPREAIREAVAPLLRMLRAPTAGREALDRARTRAARILIGPARERLARAERLVVLPDGLLHRLPFDVLPGPAEGDAGFLIERMSVRYAPSATVLRDLARRRRAPRRPVLVAFGDPLYEAAGRGAARRRAPSGMPRVGQEAPRDAGPSLEEGLDAILRESRGILAGPFRRIPGTAEEVRAVASLFPADAARVFLGPRATEERLKDPAVHRGETILHVAAHAFILEGAPLASAMALARGANGAEDGLVELREIYGLPIEADLVVLSACRSGRGEIAGGEGVLGFTRGFLYAGASDIVVSLWTVHDRASAILIPAFYRALTGRGCDPAEALRRAKIAYLREGYRRVREAEARGLPVVRRERIDARPPFYWAPYVLVGAGAACGGGAPHAAGPRSGDRKP